MTRFLVFIFLFVLSSCTLPKKSSDFEVSNYISSHISEIPVVVKGEDLTINLVNAASAEKIILYFYAV